MSGRCVYYSRSSLPTSGPYVFTDTDFLSCSSSSNGSAIYCSKSGASLTINRCTFDSCSCGSSSGGAIYANSLSILSVKNSIFTSCGGIHEAFQGGAISIESVRSILIREDLFLKCYSNENAGAIDLRNSGSEQNEIPIQSSSFIACECFNGRSPSGGAFEGSTNQCEYFSSVLFTSCKTDYGGAIWLEASPTIRRVFFSFFTQNSATEAGMDCYLPSGNNNLNPFLHCFSTTESNRINLSAYDDWLP